MTHTLSRVDPRSLAITLGSAGLAFGVLAGLLPLIDALTPFLGGGWGLDQLAGRLLFSSGLVVAYTVGGALLGLLTGGVYNLLAARFGGLLWEVQPRGTADP